jgi:hypothetical protein
MEEVGGRGRKKDMGGGVVYEGNVISPSGIIE